MAPTSAASWSVTSSYCVCSSRCRCPLALLSDHETPPSGRPAGPWPWPLPWPGVGGGGGEGRGEQGTAEQPKGSLNPGRHRHHSHASIHVGLTGPQLLVVLSAAPKLISTAGHSVSNRDRGTDAQEGRFDSSLARPWGLSSCSLARLLPASCSLRLSVTIGSWLLHD